MHDIDPNGAPPTTIGQYEVTGKLGRGSFGIVYRGRDPFLKRDVAIKLCTVDDDGLQKRFYREAEIAGKLEHEGIVAVHAFGLEDEQPYLVQEFLEGEDLSKLIDQRVAWSGRRKLDILDQVGQALAYAHDQGVIHRDVKPANVRLLAVEPEVKVKLMDFGIAKLAQDENQLTQKGVTMGTASYLPPEQVKGGEVDHRGDIFSFGVLAQELLTFERPFRGKTLSALVYQILYKQPPTVRDVWPGCPEELDALVSKCLQKEPDDRYRNFHEVLAALETLREGAAVGHWPALEVAWLPDVTPPPTAAGPQDAQDGPHPVGAESVARVGEVTHIIAPGEIDLDSTRPVSSKISIAANAVAEAQADAGADGRAAATPADAVASRQADGAGGGGQSLGGEEVAEELRTSAHEIGKLVEAGDLQAAMAQLEQTISKQKAVVLRGDGSTTGGASGAPVGVPAGGGAKVDENRATMELPEIKSPPAAPQAPVHAPPPIPDTPLRRDGRAVPSAAKTRGAGPSPKLLVGGGLFAAAAVLALGLGWWFGRERAEAPLPPPPPPPVADGTDAPDKGFVVQSIPWAWITEVTDADGYTQPIPENAATPLFLSLPEGTYTVILRDPVDNSEGRCEQVEVRADQSAAEDVPICVATFAQPTSSDYFKDAGWWR